MSSILTSGIVIYVRSVISVSWEVEARLYVVISQISLPVGLLTGKTTSGYIKLAALKACPSAYDCYV